MVPVKILRVNGDDLNITKLSQFQYSTPSN